MRARTPLAGLVLALGLAACSAPAQLQPSVSSVEPSLVYLARTVDVHLAGFATHWTDATGVSFGDGVTVNGVTAASPTALTVNVTVAAGAAIGKRDVVVTEGATAEPFLATFELASPIKVTVEGTDAEGAIFALHVDNLDLANLFDATQAQAGFLAPVTFPNLAIAAPAGAAVQVNAVTPFSIDATVLVDVNAPPAATDLDVVSGAPDAVATHFPSPGALAVTARAATPLPAGSTSGSVEQPFDSSLYAFAPQAGAAIQDLDASAQGAQLSPAMAVLPPSGAFADLLWFSPHCTVVTDAADPYYVVYWDNSGSSGYDFKLKRAETAATAFTDGDPGNDTLAGATRLGALPAVVLDARLDSFTDQDWFSYDAGAGDVGKHFHVQTVPGDPRTDTVIDVLAADGVTSLGGPSSDFDYHEDLVTSPIGAPGTYYIKIFASPTFDEQHDQYLAAVRLQ
jgi:Quinohemoprotein amine dehydrogenase, alpha subunit domain III